MRKKYYFRYLIVWALMMLVNACWAGQRDLTLAEVHVYREQLPEKTRYTYVVTNKGTAPITNFQVGYDYYIGEPELVGAKPLHIASPSGWLSNVVKLEESDLYSVSWETGTNPLQPGQMGAGFVVETATEDQQWLGSHWTVIIDGPIFSASDRLVHIEGPAPGDTVPPLINVVATPARIWPPNGGMEKINISVNVSDDTDSNPSVKLLSVSCAECSPIDVSGAEIGTDDRDFFVRASRSGKSKTGRVYLVTYHASDASGNTATATAEIVIPHDMRR